MGIPQPLRVLGRIDGYLPGHGSSSIRLAVMHTASTTVCTKCEIFSGAVGRGLLPFAFILIAGPS